MSDSSPLDPRQVKIKICGITRAEQAKAIAALPVDALGFICYPPSPRYVTPQAIREMIRELPPLVATVGVFVNESAERMIEIFRETGLSMVQLHGDEGVEVIRALEEAGVPWIKALGVKEREDLNRIEELRLNYVLLDAHCPEERGGTGRTFDWSLAVEAGERARVILAGGIGAHNLLEAIREVRPYGIDLSSSVEVSKGVKDLDKVRELLALLGRI